MAGATSILPKAVKSGWRQLGVAHCVLDVLVPEIVLNGARIVSRVRKFEADPVAQHVRVDLQGKVDAFSGARQHAPEGIGGHWSPAFRQEHETGIGFDLALQTTQGADFTTTQGMNAVDAALEAAHLEMAQGKVDLVPAKRHEFANPEAVAIRDEDHRSVAMTVATPRRGRLTQLVDFGLRQVLARTHVLVAGLRGPACRFCSQARDIFDVGGNCPQNAVWHRAILALKVRRFAQCDIPYCPDNTLFRDSLASEATSFAPVCRGSRRKDFSPAVTIWQ